MKLIALIICSFVLALWITDTSTRIRDYCDASGLPFDYKDFAIDTGLAIIAVSICFGVMFGVLP